MHFLIYKRSRNHFKLDTSAKIYPYTKTRTWNQVFRLSAILNTTIDPDKLAHAILMLRNRFPTFYVQLCNGFFWKGLRSADDAKTLYKEDGNICRPMEIGSGEKPMFRVLYSDNRVSLEVFHCVTDGSGAMCYLKTLLATYYNLLGKPIPSTDGVLNINENPKETEIENSFHTNYQPKGKRIGRSEPIAYQYSERIEKSNLKMTRGIMKSDDIKFLAKENGLTVSAYLVGLYVYSFYMNLPDKNFEKPIVVQVPINLRNIFPSETLRNFSLYASVGIEPRKEEYTFEEICKTVSEQLKEGSKKENLQIIINTNVHDEVMPVSKYSPSFVKSAILRIGFKLYGERLMTSPLSNLGVITVPKEMVEFIDHFEFVIGATRLNNIYATANTFNGKLCIIFSSMCDNEKVIDFFFEYLKSQKVDVDINRENMINEF